MSTNSAPESISRYDETPYPSAAFGQTHPNRLAAMARLLGIAAKDPSKARVLELGCADGSNLLPMAAHFPEATFVGIDASRVQVNAGQQTLAAVGLKNVELRHQDILEFPATEGKFDYIIAHGVYSWVPNAVREKILAICSEHLTETGVAYISYNAYPGWNMRRSLRDMMLYHVRGFTDGKAKVQQARALLAFLAESVPADNNAYGMLLKTELAFMGNQSDNYLLHDILGDENTPFYFHEFVGQAAKHGLQYLAEPSVAEMLAANFPEKVQQTLAQLNKQIIAQEQYMDFLRNRSFRQTLLCRSNVVVRRALQPALLKEFSFRSLLIRATGTVELVPGVPVNFIAASGAQIAATDTFVKALLLALIETKGVAAIGYAALLERSRERSRAFVGEAGADRDQMDENTLQNNLMSLLAKGFVEIHAEPIAVRTDVPAKPEVSALARHQALNARVITNRIHQSVPADLLSRYIIAACDGTRTQDEILAALIEQVKDGKLQVNEGSVKVTDEQKLRAFLKPGLEAGLVALAGAGFFAA